MLMPNRFTRLFLLFATMGYEEKLVAPALKFKNYLDKFPKLHNVYLICTITCVSGMMFGFDISSTSAFIGSGPYDRFFDSPNSTMQGFITASMSLGSFFGSLLSSFVSEPFGRRASLFICSALWMIGAAIQSSAQNRAQLIIGRIISGFGIGFGSSVAPVYGSELASRKVRGFIGGLFQLSVTVGILIMFFISYGLGKIHGVALFRVAWGIQILPGLLLFFGLFFVPESPRWLAKQGYWEEAEDIVARTQAGGNHEDPDVMIEISEIKEQLMLEHDLKAFTFARLFSKKYIARTTTAVFAQIWQQLTGMNVMMYYIVYIFDMAGYKGNQGLVSGAIQYVLNMVMTIPALFLMDKVGRRAILLTGAALMMAFQFAVAGLLAQYGETVPEVNGNKTVRIRIPDDKKPAARGVIACCYLFVVSFACSWGVGIWVYCSEVWGDNVSRQRGAALLTLANWIFNFAIAMFTPAAFENITWKTYCIYATFCACMFVHVFFFFPETKGKRLEEIAQIWEENVPAWKSKNWQPRVPLLSDAQLGEKLAVDHHEGGIINSGSHSDDSESKEPVATESA